MALIGVAQPRQPERPTEGASLNQQLSPAPAASAEHDDVVLPKLSDILDMEMLQSLMNDFYEVIPIPMGILDVKGKILVAAGWQGICTTFHRVHPETCRNCVESNTELTTGIGRGEYRLYKCKNNLWDVTTPLMLGDHHVGNVFGGQFFFDDEPLDIEYFETQAERYGFPTEQYIVALKAVPRFTRQFVQSSMIFMVRLTHILSEMSFSNHKLNQWMEERKRSEEALIRSEKLASVGRMAATVAHEINNPLAAAINCIYLAKSDTNLASMTKKHLDVAEGELQRVAHITKQTLGFYREHTNPTVVDVGKLVHEVANLYCEKAGQREVRLKIEHEGDSRIIAVAGEIRQVISNLLNNAIDASPPKNRIRIRTSSIMLNGSRYARLSVADTGSGIRRAHRSQLFKPFFTTKEAVGTGLGLWVTKEIVSKHGGRIRARSVEGKGTVFSVFLPQATGHPRL